MATTTAGTLTYPVDLLGGARHKSNSRETHSIGRVLDHTHARAASRPASGETGGSKYSSNTMFRATFHLLQLRLPVKSSFLTLKKKWTYQFGSVKALTSL